MHLVQAVEKIKTNQVAGNCPYAHRELIFFKWAIPGLFFFIFVFSIQLTVNVQYIFCRRLDLNHRPLESEATSLPTEPQPLSRGINFNATYKIALFKKFAKFENLVLLSITNIFG